MKSDLNTFIIANELEINSGEIHITKIIGKGAFGVVEKGIWRGTDIAIKVLQEKDLNISEFYTEIMILSKLHHPNILQLLGISFSEMPYSIIMEYMENGSLADHIKEKKFNYNNRLEVLKDISKGLAYLHHRKPDAIIHRDLKPSNILLTRSFKAKIADFGISCLRSNVNDETYELTGETGTYKWMAPEVMKHEFYNNKVDIFSFGMICYALFIDDPYIGLTLNSIFISISKGEVPLNMSKYKTKYLSYTLKNLILNTVTYDKNKRWDTLYMVNYCNNMMYNEDVKQMKNVCGCFNL